MPEPIAAGVLGKYSRIDIPPHPTSAIVFLHGMGGCPARNPWYNGFFATLRHHFPHSLIVAPDLGFPITCAYNPPPSSTATTVTEDTRQSSRTTVTKMLVRLAAFTILRPAAKMKAARVNRQVATLCSSQGIPLTNVALIGFSAGGAIGAYAALRRRTPYAATVVRSGFFFGDYPNPLRFLKPPSRRLHFLCSEGDIQKYEGQPISYNFSLRELEKHFTVLSDIFPDPIRHSMSPLTIDKMAPIIRDALIP